MASLVIGTAGHIDHGKSALVKALTGTDPDRLKEEQRRGITIDLGFAHSRLGDVDVAFVDVPGPERFVRNMLAGAGGIDAVLLVVAANESVMPQTREHFHICRLLGLERGVIALTKSDLADADMREIASAEVRDLVAGSFLEGAAVVPVSARTGEGLDALRVALQALATGRTQTRRTGVVRLPIDRVFAAKGFGAVVTGTLVSGEVAIGDELVMLPGDRPVRVRGLQRHGAPQPRAEAPCRLAVNVAGVDVGELARGVTLASPQTLAATRRVDVQLELLSSAPPLKHGSRIRVHQGTSAVLGRIAIAATRTASDTDWLRAGAGEIGVVVPPGAEALARIRLEQPLVVTRGDRLVLRAYSPVSTVGGAVVIDPQPPSTGLRRADVVERFERLAGDPHTAVEYAVAAAGARGLDAADLVRRLGLAPAESTRAIDAGHGAATLVHAGGRLFSVAAAARVAAQIRARLEAFHRQHPEESGMSRETLRDMLTTTAAQALVDDALQRMASTGDIAGADRLSLTTHRPLVSGEDQQLRREIAAIVKRGALSPPDVEAMASTVDRPRPAVDQAALALVRAGVLVRAGGVLFHADTLAGLKAEVRGKQGATLDVGTFKQQYGLSRKFAIPLLEWLDRERVTRRVGDRRIVL